MTDSLVISAVFFERQIMVGIYFLQG